MSDYSNARFDLFKHIAENYGRTPIESELDEIVHLSERIIESRISEHRKRCDRIWNWILTVAGCTVAGALIYLLLWITFVRRFG